jgi:hypothetical protein
MYRFRLSACCHGECAGRGEGAGRGARGVYQTAAQLCSFELAMRLYTAAPWLTDTGRPNTCPHLQRNTVRPTFHPLALYWSSAPSLPVHSGHYSFHIAQGGHMPPWARVARDAWSSCSVQPGRSGRIGRRRCRGECRV